MSIPNVTSDIILSSSSTSGDIISGSGTLADPYISNSTSFNPTVSDLPTGYISYNSADGKPQILVEQVNGTNQITSFEFKDNSGITYNTTSNLDTLFNAFAGDNFTIDMTFDANLLNETGKYILSAFEESNGVYNGFSLRIASSSSVTVSTYVNVQKINGTLTPSYNSSAARITKSNGIYSLKVTYDKNGRTQGGNSYAVLTVVAAQSRELYNTRTEGNKVPTSLTNAIVTLNGDGVDNSNNMSSITVYSFKISRN